MRIAVIANPRAARHRRTSNLIDRFRGLAPEVETLVSTTLDDLGEYALKLAQDPPDGIAISGGDGTISLTVTALRTAFAGQPMPPVIPLKSGSMNMIPSSVGVRRDPIKELKAILNYQPSDWRREWRDTVQIDGRFGCLFGFGFVTNFLDYYYESGNTGPARAARVLADTIVSTIIRSDLMRRLFARCPGRLRIDDGPWEHREWLAVLVQTIENLGIGFYPAYRAFEQDGGFHVLATDLSPGGLVRHISYLRRGRPWPAKANTIDQSARKLEFEVSGPTKYMLDGELYVSRTNLVVEPGPPIEFVRAPG